MRRTLMRRDEQISFEKAYNFSSVFGDQSMHKEKDHDAKEGRREIYESSYY